MNPDLPYFFIFVAGTTICFIPVFWIYELIKSQQKILLSEERSVQLLKQIVLPLTPLIISVTSIASIVVCMAVYSLSIGTLSKKERTLWLSITFTIINMLMLVSELKFLSYIAIFLSFFGAIFIVYLFLKETVREEKNQTAFNQEKSLI